MTPIGFFDESLGVRSMTRLTVFRLTFGAELIIATLCYVAVQGAKPTPAGMVPPQTVAIITALAAGLGVLLGGLWAALREKRKGDEGATNPPPAPDPVA